MYRAPIFPSPFVPTQRGYIKPSQPVLNLAHPLSRGLVGCWPLGDMVSGKTIDLTGLNTTIPTNIAAVGSSHHGGQATKFNGSTGYIDCGTSSVLGPQGAVSSVAWVNFTSLAAAYNGIVNRVQNTPALYHSLLVKSTGKLALYVTGTNAVNYDGTGSNTLVTGTWYQVGLTYDAIGGLRGYVNGQLDGTAAADGALQSGAATLSIGTDLNTAGRYVPGSIDAVRVYNRALSQRDMAWLFAEPYAGIVNYAPPYRVGAAAAGAAISDFYYARMVGRVDGMGGSV